MIAIITTYFNPTSCKYRFQHYQKFKEHIDKAGVDLFTIELVVGNGSFELTSEKVKQVRCNSLMFQKERLLNILIAELPDKYDSVCWMDCDLLYLQDDWPGRIEECLKDCVVCQPYQYAVSLPDSSLHFSQQATLHFYNCHGSGIVRRSLASCRNQHNPVNIYIGHVGYVWAARREFLQRHLLYDPIITGCGDLIMAMGYFGYFGIEDFHILTEEAQLHFFNWAYPVSKEVKDNVGFTSDLIVHLWHGDISDRNYLNDSRCLKTCNFSPRDLRISESGCFEWNSCNFELQNKIKQLFTKN